MQVISFASLGFLRRTLLIGWFCFQVISQAGYWSRLSTIFSGYVFHHSELVNGVHVTVLETHSGWSIWFSSLQTFPPSGDSNDHFLRISILFLKCDNKGAWSVRFYFCPDHCASCYVEWIFLFSRMLFLSLIWLSLQAQFVSYPFPLFTFRLGGTVLLN